MNKKLIIGIVAGIVILAAIVVGIILIVGSFSNGTGIISNIVSKVSPSQENKPITESSTTSEGDVVVAVPAKQAKNNDTISIPVLISKNPGFFAATLVFEYDSTALTYTGYDEGDVLDEYELNPTNGKISALINNSKNEDVKKDGTLLYLKFKIKNKSADGKYSVTIKKDGTMLGDWANEGEVKADLALGEPIISK